MSSGKELACFLQQKKSRRGGIWMITMVQLSLIAFLILSSSSVSSFIIQPPGSYYTPRSIVTTTSTKLQAKSSVIFKLHSNNHNKMWLQQPAWNPTSASKPSALFATTVPSASDGESNHSSLIPSMEGNNKCLDEKETKKFQLTPKLITVLWIHVLSIFMLLNYFWKAVPSASIFGLLPLQAWSFLHATSAMVFSGSIVTTAILEWKICEDDINDNNKKTNDNKLEAIQRLFPIERNTVLPALSLNILSGVAQVYGTYMSASLKYAPPHIKSVFHLLFLFGVWWGFTDRKTQHPLEEALATNNNDAEESTIEDEEEIKSLLKQRRLSNIVSCGFIVALYAVMIFKPGFYA